MGFLPFDRRITFSPPALKALQLQTEPGLRCPFRPTSYLDAFCFSLDTVPLNPRLPLDFTLSTLLSLALPAQAIRSSLHLRIAAWPRVQHAPAPPKQNHLEVHPQQAIPNSQNVFAQCSRQALQFRAGSKHWKT